MDIEKNGTEKWLDSATDLIESYRSLISLRITEHTSLGISMSIVGLLSMILAAFILLFTSLGAAWWLGEYMDNMKAGFFMVGGVYTLIFIILLATSRNVLLPLIRNLIIKKIYEQN